MTFFVVLIFLIVIWEMLEIIYKHTDSYRKSLGNIGNMLKNVPTGIDIANIGSGPGLYAISYDYCNKKGFNFSTAPQSYKYGFRLLKRYKENINPGAIIIIIIMCPLSFGRNNDYNRKGYSDKFYAVLPKEDIDGYSALRAVVVYHALALRVLRGCKRAIRFISRGSRQLNVSKEASIIRTWKEEFNLKDLKNPLQADVHRDTFNEKCDILRSGIEFCRQQSWRPVFVIPPMPVSVQNEISFEFLKVFVFDNLDRIKDVPKLSFYSTQFIEDSDFYVDSVFLNKKGQEKFSQVLFKEILNLFGEEI